MYTGRPENQPPQGQPQQPMPPQGLPQGAPQQPYPAQQYGQQPYYGPPPKKSNLALILILVGVFVFIPMVGCLGLAAIPLITEGNSRSARRVEAESIAGSTITQLRVLYSKNTKAIPNASDPKVRIIMAQGTGEFVESTTYRGKQTSDRTSAYRSVEGTGTLTITMREPGDGVLVYEFNFSTGAVISKVWTP